MAAISETLRQARLRSGVDLDRLAAKTKINPRYLEAIEKGDFDKLPSGIFARMFIKQYADAVGLDGASFAEEFQRGSQFGGYSAAEVHTPVHSGSASFQPSVPSFSSGGDQGRGDRLTSALSSLIWVVAAILVCAGAYYALAHLPSRTAADKQASTPTPEPAPVPKAESKPADTPAPAPESKTSAATTPDVPTPTAATPPTPQPGVDTSIQLVLTAKDPVWVTAIADGKTVLSEVLPPGTSKSFSAAKGARLTLGNAGGVDITFNGKKLEPFGPRGQVRTVDFTSWGAQVVNRTPPPTTTPPPNPDPLR